MRSPKPPPELTLPIPLNWPSRKTRCPALGLSPCRSIRKTGPQLIVETVAGASTSVGASKRGNRNIIPITGGTLSGKIAVKVLFGGADYQIFSTAPTIDARYLWQTDDGEVIVVRNTGSFGGLVPTFEAKIDGKYAWLNDGKYLSSNPGMGAGGVSLTFYESSQTD